MDLIKEIKIENDYKNIVYVGSLFSLSLYCSYKENIDETLFILPECIINDKIIENVVNLIILNNNIKPINKFEYLFLNYGLYIGRFKVFSKYIKRSCCFYIHDHLILSPIFFNFNFNLIEDGLLNRTFEPKENKIKDLFLIYNNLLGRNKRVQNILFLNEDNIPSDIKNKIILINKEKYFKEINTIINGALSANIYIDEGNVTYLLITQPLSEDGIITEDEKISIYSNIINMFPCENIIIKPHPRELTKYEDKIKNIKAIDGKSIMESLYSYENIIFITMFSSSVVVFEHNKVFYFGTCGNKKIENVFGKIEPNENVLKILKNENNDFYTNL
ncbi:polysialyltransferase family glycosyltransferase [Photobacterium leiognathi]|uniref:polysialyltransferase family glycosyltransferase n=1 Tax=Photobacterium leiognathi TaxID=553611 RepID=UPI002980AE20|nr:polysialyltransferase family glycosyltransferase [Photobacterium leiognathi]